jgi:putative NADPH-quinone reductase
VSKRVAVILGHPDPHGGHFGNALVEAYVQGAAEKAHEVRVIDVAQLEFPLLRTKQEFENAPVSESVRQSQLVIQWAEHLVIIFPLWLGTTPALLKGFLEQVFRPGFAVGSGGFAGSGKRPLGGKTARLVVTMGMPAFVYRWYFRAHGIRSLERSVLGFCGIGPIKESLIGGIESPDGTKRTEWLARMRELGRKGA